MKRDLFIFSGRYQKTGEDMRELVRSAGCICLDYVTSYDIEEIKILSTKPICRDRFLAILEGRAYLVVGTGALERDISRADKLGINKITETEFLRMIRAKRKELKRIKPEGS